MGLLTDGINEIIATTRDNAAPIGILFRNGSYSMHLFKGSHTAENIVRDGWVVANFCFDPLMYVRTAFEDPPREAFVEEKIEGVTMQRLAAAEAWAAFTAEVEKETPVALMVRLTLKKEVVQALGLHPVNRGFNSIIEASVHGTRYLMNHDPELKHLIAYHAQLVKRCGGPKEKEALKLLFEYMDIKKMR